MQMDGGRCTLGGGLERSQDRAGSAWGRAVGPSRQCSGGTLCSMLFMVFWTGSWVLPGPGCRRAATLLAEAQHSERPPRHLFLLRKADMRNLATPDDSHEIDTNAGSQIGCGHSEATSKTCASSQDREA